jgi:predicted flap endonuclease-1-like 5' DNA nuclease
MHRNGLGAMGAPLAGMALGIGFLAQEPPGRPLGIPMWGWILLFVVVIVVAVIWVLREEEEQTAQKVEELEGALEPEAKPATLAVEAAAPSPEPDDLQRIEGIGPKISALLQENGISTFTHLAEADVGRLEQILEEAGLGRLADPSSWPAQAKLAAAGDWAALEALQDQL